METIDVLRVLNKLYDAVLSDHGCFPLDRTNEKQRALNDAMVLAHDLLGKGK